MRPLQILDRATESLPVNSEMPYPSLCECVHPGSFRFHPPVESTDGL